MDTDIIIIGAGASGLAAAHELARRHKTVLVLEARDRIGGRIHTQQLPGFEKPVELGAEFVHGNLPVTISFLQQYGIAFEAIGGDMMQVEKGQFKTQHDFIEHSRRLEKRLEKVEHDMSVQAFLDEHVSDDEALRHSVQRFVEGYDAADISRASTLSFKEEWLGEDDEQYRVTGGYTPLMQAMANTCAEQGVQISLEEIVKEIRWHAGQVTVVTAGHKHYSARQVLVTVPLGILQGKSDDRASIAFIPALPEKEEALKKLGYGAVTKVILQFKNAFWKTAAFEEKAGRKMDELGFLFSDAAIPTWWTQEPGQEAMITGWLGGPNANRHETTSDDELLTMALDSLAYIFLGDVNWLRAELSAWQVANWAADHFSKGAYSYPTVNGQEATDLVAKPVDNTLFFAGEAFGHGASKSTVEAALSSGIEVAGMMLNDNNGLLQ